jgi:dolichol-phosphate mannosyltransferase
MIYIVIPVFNEELNISNLKCELNGLRTNDKIFIVFSDDGSTDNTINEINNHFSNFDYIILGDGVNYGPGNAFNRAFKWVINDSKDDLDIVVSMESDCTSDLSILPEMLMLNKFNYDLVLASVYVQSGGFSSTGFFRKFISSFANLIFRYFFNIKVLTISSFYRVYSISLLRKIKNEYDEIISENGFICMLEILKKAVNCDAKIIEVPMVLQSAKRQGESKMKVFKTSMDYLRFLLFVKFKK